MRSHRIGTGTTTPTNTQQLVVVCLCGHGDMGYEVVYAMIVHDVQHVRGVANECDIVYTISTCG